MQIRLMTHDDVPLGLRLSAQAGWNQTEADWRRFLWLAPDGCLVAEWAAEAVGTAAAFAFGTLGWIAMVLVDEAFRHRGIATRLVERALQHLHAQGVQTARLDATAFGRPVYERLGFLAEYRLLRMHGTAGAPSADPPFAALSADRLRAVCDLDAEVTGTRRGRLIQRLYAERPESATAVFDDAAAAGYAFSRPGRRAAHLGPAAAVATAAGVALLDRMLARCPAGPVLADIPVDNPAAVEWAEAHGFAVQREYTRMYRGRRIADCPQRIWASSGPEKG
ncbi:MAG: GNAT family N-acetyltransferase [Candidatus Anammoximicrobium sp.]|nr:GNAT family N-acetyltransferase [Candidatus Anammoximicrobium sp.]